MIDEDVSINLKYTTYNMARTEWVLREAIPWQFYEQTEQDKCQ